MRPKSKSFKEVQQYLKYRYIFGKAKRFRVNDVRSTDQLKDTLLIHGNPLWIAYQKDVQGGGAIQLVDHSLLLNAEAHVKLDPDNEWQVEGHKGQISDFSFNPFNDNMLATSGVDGCVKVKDWTKSLVVPTADLKCTSAVKYLRWNQSAENIIASGHKAPMIDVWNASTEQQVCKVDCVKRATDVRWNYNGTLLGVPCEDHKFRIIDPRSGKTEMTALGNLKGKMKFAFLGTHRDYCVSVGYAKGSPVRELALWDLRNLDERVVTNQFQGTSQAFVEYDEDSSLCCVTGKGDSGIEFSEFYQGAIYKANRYADQVGSKSQCLCPRRMVDYNNNEICRYLRLGANYVEQINMKVSQKEKGVGINPEYYPPCFSEQAALTAEDWLGGKSADPVLREITEQGKGQAKVFVKKEKINMEQVLQEKCNKLEGENQALKARVAVLEALLQQAQAQPQQPQQEQGNVVEVVDSSGPAWYPEPEGDWQYRVTYFAYHGRAEACRVALELAGVKWVNNVVDYQEYMKKYQGGTLNGYVPVLEANGSEKKYDQGKELCRLVCQKHGMYPEDKMEKYRCEQLVEMISTDLKFYNANFFQAKPEERLQWTIDRNTEVLEKFMGVLEKHCGDSINTHGFAVTNKLSIADAFLLAFIESVVLNGNRKEFGENLLPNFPALSKYWELHSEKLADYMNNRRVNCLI